MNRRRYALGPAADFAFFPKTAFLSISLLIGLLSCVLIFVAGCKKKSRPVSAAAVRNITRELVFAVHNASGGRAEVGTRPE